MDNLGDLDKPKAAVVPHPVLTDYYGDERARVGFVGPLFDRTARHYDRINRIFSLGMGDFYRRRCLRRAGLRPGMRMLDAAIGTGGVARQALALLGRDADVVGLDASAGMLREARSLGIPLVRGSMDDLPIAPSSVDFLSIGYALRHAADLVSLFREVRRVLRPGGIVLVLEIGMPARPLPQQLLEFYLGRVVPRLARIASGARDTRVLMEYYWDTIRHCVPQREILRAMVDGGFGDARCTTEWGVFQAYTGRVPHSA